MLCHWQVRHSDKNSPFIDFVPLYNCDSGPLRRPAGTAAHTYPRQGKRVKDVSCHWLLWSANKCSANKHTGAAISRLSTLPMSGRQKAALRRCVAGVQASAQLCSSMSSTSSTGAGEYSDISEYSSYSEYSRGFLATRTHSSAAGHYSYSLEWLWALLTATSSSAGRPRVHTLMGAWGRPWGGAPNMSPQVTLPAPIL